MLSSLCRSAKCFWVVSQSFVFVDFSCCFICDIFGIVQCNGLHIWGLFRPNFLVGCFRTLLREEEAGPR